MVRDVPIVTEGSVQGIIHAWHVGADPRFFQIRELITKNLVRCEYDEDFHDRIHKATATAHAVVHVYGRMEWDTASNAVIKVCVNDIEIAEPLSDSEFERLFGA